MLVRIFKHRERERERESSDTAFVTGKLGDIFAPEVTQALPAHNYWEIRSREGKVVESELFCSRSAEAAEVLFSYFVHLPPILQLTNLQHCSVEFIKGKKNEQVFTTLEF